MPTETFFNLPEEKKEKIINAAITEFAERSYHQARVTAIINRAGIARGSFYQYFADKKDLFTHIMDKVVNRKIEYISQDMMEKRDKYSFFELLHEIYLSGIKFAKDNPQLVGIGNRLLNNKELQQEIWGEKRDQGAQFYKSLLAEALEKGELNPEIDIELVSVFLSELNYSLIDIIYKNNEIDLDLLEDDGMKVVDKMIDFIKNGIKK